MIDIPTLLENILIQFQADITLSSYVKGYEYGMEELELVKDGVFPIIGINIYDIKTEAAPGMNPLHMIRRVMPLVIFFAVRQDLKKTALYGSATEKGCLQMFADIDAAMRTDKTFGMTGISTVDSHPDYASDAFKHSDFASWVGQGMMIYELYSDENIV